MTPLVPAGLPGLGTGAVLGLVGGDGSVLAVPAPVYGLGIPGLGIPIGQAVPASLLIVAGTASPVSCLGYAGVGAAFVGAAVHRLLPERVLPKALAVGAGVGFLTGLLGGRRRVCHRAALTWLLGLPIPAAIGTSLVILGINSLARLAAHLGQFTLDLAVLVAVQTALGTTLHLPSSARSQNCEITALMEVMTWTRTR